MGQLLKFAADTLGMPVPDREGGIPITDYAYTGAPISKGDILMEVSKQGPSDRLVNSSMIMNAATAANGDIHGMKLIGANHSKLNDVMDFLQENKYDMVGSYNHMNSPILTTALPTVGGALAGGSLGAYLAYMAREKKADAIKGALAGALLGGAGGYMLGDRFIPKEHVDSKLGLTHWSRG